MKTKEELLSLKNEVEALNKKLAELTEDELNQVAGGFDGFGRFEEWAYDIVYKKDGEDVEDISKPGDYTPVIR